MIKGGENVMRVGITVIYLSNQGVSNIGYFRSHKCLSFYKHSCCKNLIISFVRNFRNQWLQVVKYAIIVVIYCSLWLLEAEHRRSGNELFYQYLCERSSASAKDKLYEYSQVPIVLDSAVHLLSKNKIWTFCPYLRKFRKTLV